MRSVQPPPRRSASRRVAFVHGDDQRLAELLTDVLRECGVQLSPPGCGSPDVVLVHVSGVDGLMHLQTVVRATHAGTPVVAVLPFADETLGRASLLSGASAYYALGTPLRELEALIDRVMNLPSLPRKSGP